MDHTLVRYHTKAFEELAYNIMVQKLIRKGYPEKIANCQFAFDDAIRGLIIDKNRGNLLKVSRHGAIRSSRHGLRMLDFLTQQKEYTGTYIDLGAPHYSAIDTSFSLSVAILFSQIIEMKDAEPELFKQDYLQIFEDVVYNMDEAHRDGSIKNIVAQNLEKYILKDARIVQGLERYKKHDKKIFIVTNSDFQYTKLLLDYAVNPFLKENKSWMELFHVVVTAAQKPRFFWDNLKFLKVNTNDGTMTNYDERLVPGVYQGGCATIFEKDFQVTGDDILYVGDHIYGDIVRLKKDCRWRTALVVEEMEDEIKNMLKAGPLQTEITSLMEQKEPLELELVDLVTHKVEGTKVDEKRIDQLQDTISEIDKRISPLIRQQATIFNPFWGEIMRAGNEESYFAHQVDRFADIYMARLSDLFDASPRTYFRSKRRPLAHELALSMILSDEIEN